MKIVVFLALGMALAGCVCCKGNDPVMGSWEGHLPYDGMAATSMIFSRGDNGEAKVVTLMIGTNNSLGYKPENVAAGIRKCVDVIREKQPKAKVVLMAILPRYGDSEEKVKRRACNDAVNAIIKGYADGENVFWLDMNPKFPPVGGDAYKEVCPDSTHPNEKGYEIWAAELQPYLKKYVGK